MRLGRPDAAERGLAACAAALDMSSRHAGAAACMHSAHQLTLCFSRSAHLPCLLHARQLAYGQPLRESLGGTCCAALQRDPPLSAQTVQVCKVPGMWRSGRWAAAVWQAPPPAAACQPPPLDRSTVHPFPLSAGPSHTHQASRLIHAAAIAPGRAAAGPLASRRQRAGSSHGVRRRRHHVAAGQARPLGRPGHGSLPAARHQHAAAAGAVWLALPLRPGVCVCMLRSLCMGGRSLALARSLVRSLPLCAADSCRSATPPHLLPPAPLWRRWWRCHRCRRCGWWC